VDVARDHHRRSGRGRFLVLVQRTRCSAPSRT
jgi:hypothetical protein